MSTFSTIWLLFWSYYCQHVIKSQISCHDDHECAFTNITSGGLIMCYGFGSCFQATQIVANNLDRLYCWGSFSCYNANKIHVNARDISCNGLYSCANVIDIKAYNGDIIC